MNAVALAAALAALAVDYQVETTTDNQQQYTIQIEPEILKLVASGEEIHSEVPAEAGHVQRLCIRIGTTRPQHTAAGEAAFRQLLLSASRWASADRAISADAPPTILWPSRTIPEQTFRVSYGFQPDTEGRQAYYVQLDPAVLRTLAAGDEIYAPIDPAAGRLSRFIVSSGNKQLPQVAAATQPAITPLQHQVQPPVQPPLQPPAFGSGGRTTIDLLPLDGGGRTQFQPGGGNFNPNAQSPLAPRQDFNALPPAEAPPSNAGAFQSPRLNPPANPALDNRGGYSAPPAAGYGTAAGYEQPRTSFGANAGAPSQGPLQVADSRGFGPGGGGYQPPAGAASGQAGYAGQGSYGSSANYPQPPIAGFGSPQDQRLAQLPQPPTASLPTGSLPPANAATLPSVTAAGSLTAPATAQAPQSWGIFVVVLFALFFSIGGNLYLAWTALEFHNRYRSAIDRLRSAARNS